MSGRHALARGPVASGILLATLVFMCALGSVGCGASLNHEASLTVTNHSDFTICDVYVAPGHGDEWGEDQLEEGELMAPETARTFDVPAGRWNVRMDDCAGRALYARRDLQIRGARRLDFRPAEVDRQRYFGARRFAARPGQSF